ncbi:hypothetical protein BgiBS90_014308, partial [Biomphalaria glabrata]
MDLLECLTLLASSDIVFKLSACFNKSNPAWIISRAISSRGGSRRRRYRLWSAPTAYIKGTETCDEKFFA